MIDGIRYKVCGLTSLVDAELSGQMALVRRVVELGRAARASATVKNRQPLASLAVFSPGWDALPEQLLALGYNILKALTGNANFPIPPVDLAQLKTALDSYAVLIGEANDGGTKAITARNKQGEDIIRMLRSLALYVELYCKEDMNAFLSSGFQPRSTTRTPVKSRRHSRT